MMWLELLEHYKSHVFAIVIRSTGRVFLVYVGMLSAILPESSERSSEPVAGDVVKFEITRGQIL